MDSLDIEYFLQVANQLSFTKAADILSVSQSSISKKIHHLETELSVLLFSRNSKRVELTQAGVLLKNFFESTTQNYKQVLTRARQLENVCMKSMRIGLIEGWNIAKYMKHFNECSFLDYDVTCDKINNLVKQLVRNEIDIIIGAYKGINQALEIESIKNVIVNKLIDIPRIIYFSKNHPLADKPSLQLTDFKEDIFYTGKSRVAKENALRICEKAGFIPNRFPVNNPNTTLVKLSSGCGYALSEDLSIIKDNIEYKYFYIDDYQEVGLAYINDDLDEYKQKYIDEITTIFKNYSKIE